MRLSWAGTACGEGGMGERQPQGQRSRQRSKRWMDTHRMMGAEARTGNSHKEMKIKGGITGRREACSDSQAIREVSVLGVPMYYSHGPAPPQLLRCMCPTRTIHTHSKPPFSHFLPGSHYRWQIVVTTAPPGGVQPSDLTGILRRRRTI